MNINQALKEQWYIQGFNCTPNLIYFGMTSGIVGCNKKVGYGYSAMIHVFKNDYNDYHYDVKDHQLTVLWGHEFSDEEILQYFTYPWIKDAGFLVVLTAVFDRTTMKYGDRGYRYILLEAGHIGQNLVNTSTLLNLKVCPLGGTRDEALETLLCIDGITESVVYGLAIGK